jgi:DNA-binding beta-propeller fold protein YncE
MAAQATYSAPAAGLDSIGRRRFLSGLTMTAAALASSELSGLRAAASDDRPVILGDGRHRYEWVRGWGKLPDGVKYGSTHGGVAVDAQNRVYVSTDGNDSIIVFDQDGKYLRSMGPEWKPDKDGDGTHDMQLHAEGNQEFIYLVSLFRHEFAKLTLQGETVWIKGFPEQAGIYKSKNEFKPTGMTVAPTGDLYVTDGYGANYVHRYNAKGEYLNSWGGKCSQQLEDGKFNTPHKITIDRRGKEPLVLVTDRANHRLQWFTLEGKHVKTLDGSEHDFLRLPSVINIRETDIAIGDLAGRVTIIDRDNRLVTHLGDSGDPKKRATNRITPDQWVDGQFIAPHGLSWDRQGNLYVSEWMLAGRVVKLRRLA